LRMCYLKDEDKLLEGLDRFKKWLASYEPS
jgi:hypothetical protein